MERNVPLLNGLSTTPKLVDGMSVGGWTLLLASAEAIGMTASAAAARVSTALVGERPGPGPAAVALLVIVAGGLVEGAALGILQSAGLKRWLPRFRRRRWIVATILVAGLGWAAASAPSVFLAGGDESTAEPPLLLSILGAGALGAAMGVLLGAAQAAGLRGLVRHPWRWIGISAAGWAPAMAVIFVGASIPDATWPDAGVVICGSATGLVAGTVLALVTWPLMPLLEGSSLTNRIVVSLLRSPAHRALDRSLMVLRLRGKVTGHLVELPVQYAADAADVVIVPGHPERKKWWRNLERPSAVQVLLAGEWRHGVGAVLRSGDDGYSRARSAYRTRWPRLTLPDRNPIVVVKFD